MEAGFFQSLKKVTGCGSGDGPVDLRSSQKMNNNLCDDDPRRTASMARKPMAIPSPRMGRTQAFVRLPKVDQNEGSNEDKELYKKDVCMRSNNLKNATSGKSENETNNQFEFDGQRDDTGKQNSKPQSDEDGGELVYLPESSGSKSEYEEYEDDLTREQRLSALKVVSESDTFMDQLKKAKTEINNIRISTDEEKRGWPDPNETQTKINTLIESWHNFEILLCKNSTFQSNNSTNMGDGDATNISFLPKQNPNSGYTKSTELSTWVEKGIWMTNSSSTQDTRQIVPQQKSEISPVSTMSSGVYLLEEDKLNPTVQNDNTAIDYKAATQSGLDRSPTDTEIYLTGAPQEFSVDSNEDLEPNRVSKGSLSASFVSLSPEVLALAAKNKTTNNGTDWSDQVSLVTPRSDETHACFPRPDFPTELEGKHENIYFDDDCDGVEFDRDSQGEQFTQANLLWANSKYLKDNQVTVPLEESGGPDSHEEPEPDSEFLNCIQRDSGIADIVETWYTDDHYVPLLCGGIHSRVLEEKDADHTPQNSTQGSVYGDTYLGRADIFRPILTVEERRMLGVPSDTSSSEYEGPPVYPQENIELERLVVGEINLKVLEHPNVPGSDENRIHTPQIDYQFHRMEETSILPPVVKRPRDWIPTPLKHPTYQEQNNSRIWNSENCESGESSIVKVEDSGSGLLYSSFSESIDTKDYINLNLSGLNILNNSKSPLVRSKCSREADKSDSGFVHKGASHTHKTNFSSGNPDTSIRENNPNAPNASAESWLKLSESPSNDSKRNRLLEGFSQFFETKNDLKRDVKFKIKLLKQDAKLSRSAIKKISDLEIQEISEFSKNEQSKIQRETKYKTYQAEKEYRLNKSVMIQDKWKGTVRELIENRRNEQEMRKSKLELKLGKLDTKMKKKRQELLAKSNKKAEEADKLFRKKLRKIKEKISKHDCMVNGSYVPLDDLLLDNWDDNFRKSSSSSLDSSEHLLSTLSEKLN